MLDQARALVRRHRSRLLLGSVASALVLAYLLRAPGVLFVDTRPDLYLNPGRLIASCWHSWSGGTSLGAPNFDVGYLPPAMALWMVTTVGTPAWLAMRLWRLGLFLLAAWGADRFTTRTFPGAWSTTARLTAALGYSATTYALVGASSTPVMLPMALLPWLLLAFQRCLEPGGWRAAPLVGLALFAMGGMNGGVVNIFVGLALPVVWLDARWRLGRSWRTLLAGAAAALGAGIVVSLYWIVATGLAFTSASTVAGTTESPQTVAATSSYAEVMRGLGGWLVYGADRAGPFAPGTTDYVTSPLLILATFALPLLAVLGVVVARTRAAWLAWGLVLVGVVAMVGMYPSAVPTPFGRMLGWAFDHVPGFLALRSTNKAGPVLVLGLAALAGLAVNRALSQWQWRARWALSAALVAAWVLPLLPAVRADFFANQLRVPTYWTQAAQDLSDRSDTGRVWLIPGETNALYRWRGRGVDDFASSVVERPSFFRRTYPDVPAASANLLAALDTDLQNGRTRPGELAAAARYLGAGDLLVRNDMRWETVRGARPSEVMAMVERDPGLRPSAIYGPAGVNVVALGRLGERPSADRREAELAPVFRYAVADPGQYVRTEPLAGHVIIVGDNAGAARLMGQGLLDGHRPFDLLGSLSADQAATLLEQGARIVLTDTNRRREANDRTLDRSGPLLSPSADIGPSRALFGPDDQTVARYGDAADVVATASGSIFGPEATGRIGLAFDGDPDTAWQLGDFQTGRGQSVTIDLGEVRSVAEVRIDVEDSFPTRISRVRVQLGTTAVPVEVADDESGVARFPAGTEGRTVVITVSDTEGGGTNQVGISEIGIAGLDLTERARLPETLDHAVAANDALAAAVASAPLDVSLAREHVVEKETALRREFSLPTSRSFTVSGVVSGVRAARKAGGGRGCVAVAEIDGQPIKARLGRRSRDDTARFEGCAGQRVLSSGPHQVAATGRLVVDELELTDARAPSPPPVTDPAPVIEWSGSQSGVTVDLPPLDEPVVLVVAESFDERWIAEVDGASLGPAVVADGFALGWWIEPGAARTVSIRYGPQRLYAATLLLSLTAAAGCAAYGLWGVVGRSRRTARQRAAESEDG